MTGDMLGGKASEASAGGESVGEFEGLGLSTPVARGVGALVVLGVGSGVVRLLGFLVCVVGKAPDVGLKVGPAGLGGDTVAGVGRSAGCAVVGS